MRTFIDNRGATWAVELTVLSFKRTRADFGDLLNPEYFLEKTADPVFLIDLLFALCSDKAKEAGLDADGFAGRFSGDRVDEAREALTQEYVDFFPSRAREPMRAALAKIEEIREEMIRRETETISKIESPSETSGDDGSSS